MESKPPQLGVTPPDVVEYGSLRELLLPLYFPGFLSHTTRSLTLTVLPLHVLSMGFSYEDVGMLATVMGVGAVLGNIPAGSMTTAHGPRFTLLVSCCMFASAAALSVTAAVAKRALALPCLIPAYFLAGVAESLAILARQVFMGAVVPTSLRGRVASAQGGMQRFAFVAGTSLGGFVAEMLNPHAAYVLQALLALLTAMVILTFMPYISATQNINARGPAQTQADAGSSKQAGAGGLSMLGVLRAHGKLLLVAAAFTGCAFFIRKSRELLFSLEGHERNMSQAEVGRLAAFSFLIDGALFPLGGYSMDKLGRTRTGAISYALAAVAVLALQSRSSAAMLSFAVVGGISNGISSGLALTVGADLAPPDCRSNFLAVFRMLARSADPASASVLGVLAEATSLQIAELVVCVIALSGIACALCCMPETLQKPSAKSSAPSSGKAKKGYSAVAPDPVALGRQGGLADSKASDLDPSPGPRTTTLKHVTGDDQLAILAQEDVRPAGS